MDTSAFLALFRHVRNAEQPAPPRLVLAVLTYLEGLGYVVVCRGDVAARYADEGAANGPARDAGTLSDAADVITSSQTTSYWYVLDMVRDDTSGQLLVDQMLVHARMTEDAAFVHCSRSVWKRQQQQQMTSGFRQVDVRTSGYVSQTICTLENDGMLELRVATYDDGAELRQVDSLMDVLSGFFCKGSARAAHGAGTINEERGGVHDDRSVPAPMPFYGGAGSHDGGGDPNDPDRLRVGRSDLDPVDGRGSGHAMGPDGMMVGPHHPIFGRGRMEPPPGHEGHLPPGGRWDPIAPPGMQGFFPGDFERGRGRGRGRGGNEIHPDLEDIMQPGRGTGGFPHGGGFP